MPGEEPKRGIFEENVLISLVDGQQPYKPMEPI